MDSNGIISFEVERDIPILTDKSVPTGKFRRGKVKYTACFGMKFKGIFGEMLAGHEGHTSAVDWFTYQLYAGLCNEAYLQREPYPIFRDVVDLVEIIIEKETELQTKIYDCYENSKAGKEIEKLLQALSGEKKSEADTENLAGSEDLQNMNEIGQQLVSSQVESSS